MARQGRSYTCEFKVEAVKLVTEMGYSGAEAEIINASDLPFESKTLVRFGRLFR
jgi:transposase-like protein